MLVSYILYVLMFPPDGGYEKETHPVEVPACVPDAEGKIVEDSTCGIKACLLVGKKRAAQLAGERPGIGFGLICNKTDGSEKETIGAEPAGGHASMNWQPTR